MTETATCDTCGREFEYVRLSRQRKRCDDCHYPSKRPAYARVYKRLARAGLDLPPLERPYACIDCGERRVSKAQRGFPPIRCPKCRHEKRRLLQKARGTFGRRTV